jgi:hypothetical protein
MRSGSWEFFKWTGLSVFVTKMPKTDSRSSTAIRRIKNKKQITVTGFLLNVFGLNGCTNPLVTDLKSIGNPKLTTLSLHQVLIARKRLTIWKS